MDQSTPKEPFELFSQPLDLEELQASLYPKEYLTRGIARITGLTFKQADNIVTGASKPSAPAARLLQIYIAMTPEERARFFPPKTARKPRKKPSAATIHEEG